MKTVLVCRPQPQADRTAKVLETLGFEPLVAPMLVAEPTGLPLPHGAFAASVVTSAHAAFALQDTPMLSRPAWCVGDATAAAASRAGVMQVRSVAGDAAALAAEVSRAFGKSDRLLHPCAETTAFDMVTALAEGGIECVAWPVYRMVAAEILPEVAKAALADSKVHAVLLTSQRIAATFTTLVPHPPDGTRLLAMSGAIAAALSPDMAARCEVAREPNEAALLSLLTGVS